MIAPMPPARDPLWRPALIVFISNICIMVIELVASRLLAPVIGVSLYTWTSIIGVMLAGISLGNFAGGKLADRFASRRLLGVEFALAGLGSLGVLAAMQAFGNDGLTWAQTLPLFARMALFIAAIFGLPSIMLGLISPLVIKLSLLEMAGAGAKVGRIYAASALGSIVGTFATGFWLVSAIGTRPILLGAGALLIAMGALLGRWFRRELLNGALAVGLALTAAFAVPAAWVASTCFYETDYFCIKVRDEDLDGRTWRVLVLDRLVHSYTALGDPTPLRYAYERVGAEVSEFLQDRDGAQRVFFIGGGGYTLPKFIEHRFPDALIDVAEIDPMVTETAYRHLELVRPGGAISKTNITPYSQDARLFLVNRAAQPGAPRYNFVLGDAFNDFSVPYHLTTREFNQLVRAQLTDDGIYMLNLIDGNDLPFVTAFIRTLRQTFPYVYFVPTGGFWKDMTRNTFVLLASPGPIDIARLSGFEGGDGTHNVRDWLVSGVDFEAFINDGPKVLLTDDYVPTANLLAPMFDAAAM